MSASAEVRTGWRCRPALALAALPVAALVAPLSILAVVAWLTWLAVWEDAHRDILREAESVAEYGLRALESYSVAAGRLNDRLRGMSDDDIRANERTLHEELYHLGHELTQSDLSYVIDRHGRPLLSSNLYPVPRDGTLADREYFQGLRGPSPPSVYVSRTFIGRFDGRLLFAVSRRRQDSGNPPAPDGFDGVVLVSVNPHVLADGMRRLLNTPQDRMALMLTDGAVLSTTGGATGTHQPLPRADPSSPFHAYAAAGVDRAIYMSATALPGTTAVLAMRRVQGFPVYAVALRPRDDIVARWRDLMLPNLLVGLPATLGLLLLSLRVMRDQRKLAASNIDLQMDNALTSNRLDRAKRFGLVGTFEFDLRSGVSRRSPEYMSVHGLPAAATAETHADWLARVHPDDRERANALVRQVLSDDSDATEYGQTYRIVTATGEVRWIAARGEIQRDADGRAVMMLGAHVDVTPLRTTELALAESDARLRLAQEALGIGTWEWLGRPRRLVWSRRMLELWGFDPAQGQPSLAAAAARLHPADRWQVGRALAKAQRTGHCRHEFRILRLNPGAEAEVVWLNARGRLLAPQDGGSHRLMGVAYDITERKRADEMTELLAREVEHRAKNTLAVVSSLLRMSNVDGAEDVVEVIDGRVKALSRTMALLGRGRWKGAPLRDIIEGELRPFAAAGPAASSTGGFAIDLSGPSVQVDVDCVQPLSMALHELATNAAKYGALSRAGGSLRVTWQVDTDRLHLRWQERGGPTMRSAPPQSGFGSRLIAMLVEGQLRGVVNRRWEAEGLVCELSFPHRPAA